MDTAERALFRLQASSVHALSHGDAHIGNTYLDADRQPGFYDWQTFCLAPPLDDVSYFIAGAMTVADRRTHEQDLLRHYLSALAALGAPTPSWDEAWLTYRTYQAHGFFWAVLPASRWLSGTSPRCKTTIPSNSWSTNDHCHHPRLTH
jgi:aminoglycoside phosphotransferase (APT) family kinase protein